MYVCYLWMQSKILKRNKSNVNISIVMNTTQRATPVSLVSWDKNASDDTSLCDKFSHVTDLHFPTHIQHTNSSFFYFVFFLFIVLSSNQWPLQWPLHIQQMTVLKLNVQQDIWYDILQIKSGEIE